MICLIISFVIFFKPTLTDKKTDIEFDSYNHIWENELENWSILTSFSELKILKKYAGELRMGPGFFHIKTESNNIFGKEFYGDWFYRIENGIYLQKWNSNPIKNGIRTKADNDLIFYDRIKNEIRIIETGIESFHWKMEKDELGLSLISNNGKTEERIRITNANNGYN
ncbi:hypothetical protein SAMN04488096_1164 [Mesonia phycicola]|uniref:Uncharacterized protein n=2 Tax=Mesonia phycicola TaxID=579105 RepID=A0A1M6HNR5_9FLAO|nr:hypothetical protein SAMN04488096_1164 [Mesonia phycicola]